MMYILTFEAFFSDVKVQVEAEDTAMMQQLKPEDFVCFTAFLSLAHICTVVNSPFSPSPLPSYGFVQCLMLVYMVRWLCWMKTGRMSYLSR
jgi:hypothetical protein